MTPATCANPALGERVLERARGGRSALPRELAAHVAECAECSVALERGRRMATAMRELKPTRAEIAAARARYVARRGGSRGRRLAPLVVALGSLLFTALAFAGAVRFAVMHGVLGESPVKEATVPGTLATPRGPSAATRAAAEPAATSVETETAPPPTATRVATASASLPSTATATATPTSTSTSTSTPTTPHVPVAPASSPSASSPSRSPSSTGGSTSSSSAPSTSLPAPSPWILAADAMRAHDYPTAERAFAQLATSSDRNTRDEARLARAQVWLAEGRAGVARPELVELASNGATSLVRERAAEALRGLGGSASP